ncbi:MAG: PAS domain-containing sensor histidine kinase [Pseudomonadota bacterium]|nr:PAS domain-containing sensor histidine kinase [Pseudomonadota bacterium]
MECEPKPACADADSLPDCLLEQILAVSPAIVGLRRVADDWPVTRIAGGLRRLGFEPVDIAGGWLSIVHPADRDRVLREADGFLKDGRDRFALEYRVKSKTGESRWMDDRIVAMRDKAGHVTHLSFVAFDITSRKQMEENLLRTASTLAVAKREAKASSRSKSQFLAMMSHELRTPLNAILGFSEIIRDKVLGIAALDTYSEYAGDIHVSARILLDLINDILDVSKIEAGKYRLHREPVDLVVLLAGCIRLLDIRARAKGIPIVLDIGDPPPDLVADERALKQILFNLLSNAVKFTPENGRIVVRVRRKDDNSVSLAVVDTGIGIPSDQIAKVLKPFEQVDSHTDFHAEGTGLGLALVKSLMELHGGRLILDSEVDKGTTATCLFPSGARSIRRRAHHERRQQERRQ